MGQPYNLRQGWQSENLARYLLSKIAFVSQPITISDDFGLDFLCTLFEKKKIEKQDILFPRNSFAIQIKSKKGKKWNITDKESYIRHLEIPFFWGIVDKKKAKIEIYSGEYFESFIAHIGGIAEKQKLFLEIVEERDEKLSYYFKENFHYVKFPKVLEINVGSNYSDLELDPFFETCDLMIKNIAARIKGSYLFEIYGGKNIRIYTGPNSAKLCEENFYRSLTEVFQNLLYIYTYNKDIKKEFEVYKKFFLQLCQVKGDKWLPNYLIESFKRADDFFLYHK